MSTDADGDSPMVSTTTTTNPLSSPPSSQQHRRSSANANGKRPLNTISNGHDRDEYSNVVEATSTSYNDGDEVDEDDDENEEVFDDEEEEDDDSDFPTTLDHPNPHISDSAAAMAGGGQLRRAGSGTGRTLVEARNLRAAGATGDPLSAGRARQEFSPKTHTASGYTWSRAEDEPGAAWTNKKAVDELQRALDGCVHREAVVGGRYGDPFEAVDRERAILNSLTQR